MNKFFKNIWNFIKKNWFGIILFIWGVVLIMKYRFFEFFLISTFGWIMLLYLIMKVNSINVIIRTLLNMRVDEDEQKAKRKNKKYEKEANKTAFKVKKFTK